MQAVSKSLVSSFIDIIRRLRESSAIYDTCLCVNGEEIHGNRLLLSAVGTTFREMFEAYPQQSRFTLKKVDPDATAMIVESSFTFTYVPLNLTDVNLTCTLQTGIHLGCLGALEECCRYIERNTRCSTCMRYQHILWRVIKGTACLAPCDLNLLRVVLKYVTFFIAKNFAGVCVTEGFKLADANAILSLIKLNDLYVSSEDTVLAAVRAWYLADPVNHRNSYVVILKQIRWPLLSRACLEAASNEEEIWSCSEVQELIRKSFLYQLRDRSNRNSIDFGHCCYLTMRRGMIGHKR